MPRLPEPRFAPDCAIVVDGRRVPARAGESVAAALLAAGRPVVSRSPRYHRPRGPFCLSGSCGSCLARVDGLPSRRTCRTPCREGLRVETQNAFPGAAHDLLGVLDRLFPRGIDPHHLLLRPRLANRAMLRLSRRLAGLGRLPDAFLPPPAAGPPGEERFDALVVGAGPAGLGAAEALSAAGRRVLLLDEAPALGGRLRAALGLPGDPPLAWAEAVAASVVRAGGEVALRSAVVGLWRDGGAPLCGIAAEVPAPRLRLARAPRLVLCPGGTARPPLFEDADLPGVQWGRGLAVALAEHGVVPGRRAAVLGSGPEAGALAARLAAAGMEVAPVAGPVIRARGRRRLAGIVLRDGARLDCDTAAVVDPPAPACELARQAGAAVDLDETLGAHAVRAGPDGSTGVPGLSAAGEATGACTAAGAADAGRRAGEAARG